MDSPISSNQTPPEVTIEPADNGFIVRHYQRGGKKDESGRTIRRVASSVDDALEHARSALGGAGKAKSAKRKPVRDGQSGAADAGGGGLASAVHSSHTSSRGRARRHPRVGGRR